MKINAVPNCVNASDLVFNLPPPKSSRNAAAVGGHACELQILEGDAIL